MTKVINKYKSTEKGVYIGRGSIFGNPYEIGRDGTREEVIARYRIWFNFLLRDNQFRTALLNLRGKNLVCFCSPQSCHGDVIAEYLNNL